MLKIAVTLSLLMLCLPHRADAFNSTGHKIIAEIAWQKLTAHQRQAIVAILRNHPRFVEDFKNQMPEEVVNQGAAAQDHWIFCQAAVWPDIARGIPHPEREMYHRPFWHFINLPVFLDAEQAAAFNGNLTANVDFVLPSDGDESTLNGVQAVKNSLRIVTTSATSAEQKAIHLCWLIHVIPDLAQPLHSASLFTEELFPAGDKGGNSIKIKRQGTGGSGQNMHAVWDSLLGKDTDFNVILGKANDIVTSNPAEFNAPFVAMPHDVWSTESQAVASQVAYGPLLADIQEAEDNQDSLGVIKVPQSYFTNAGSVVRKQAVTAGVRLAGVLAGTVPSSGGHSPFTVGGSGLPFPAAIASHRTSRQSDWAEVEEAPAATDQAESGALALRVKRLEAEVARLQSRLDQGASAPKSLHHHGNLAARARAAKAHDDVEQCDCGLDK